MAQVMQNGWIIWGCLTGGCALLAWVVGLLWNRVVMSLTLKTATELDNVLARVARRPVQSVIFSAGSFHALKQLQGYAEIGKSIITPYLEGLLMVWTVLAVTWLAIRVLEELVRWYLDRVSRGTEVRLDLQFMPLLTRILRLTLFFVAATIVLGFYNIKITALLGVAGVASLALALAAQDTLANMIGGMTIMIDRPFRIGDRIQLHDGTLGDVHEIGLRTTKILTFDRTMLIIPNAELVKQMITNHSYPDPQVFTRQTLGVAYGSDLDKVKRVLLEVINSHPQVLKEPPAQIYFTDFADSSLDLFLYYSVGSYANRFAVADDVNMAIKKRFEAEGIEIPFPQRDVHLKQEKG